MKTVARQTIHQPRQGRGAKKSRSISSAICEAFFGSSDVVTGDGSFVTVGFHSVRAP